MAHIFISYARADEPKANDVAEALRTSGYEVWRDDELPAHRSYADVIEERLAGAEAVVVLWSGEAVKSQWVRAEADAARSAGTLVQAGLDGTMPPMPFNQIQCADLTGWKPGEETSGWRKLEASVRALAGAGSTRRQEPPRPTSRPLSICVLPFANMSGDAEQDYFSDGISEDITTDLSNVSALAVTARNTAFTYKGRSIRVPEVARELGVSHVLEGSVRKVANRVRITAQLIDGATGDHVWAQRFDRDLTDIFAIQDEISKAIVDALKVKLLPEEKKAIETRGTSNVEAYSLYLKARQLWVSGNHGDPHREEQVIRICSLATEVDPLYATAWALLSIAQSGLHYGFGQPGDNGVAAAQRALSIDPSIPEAHCAIARRLTEERRFAEAEAEISKAVELDGSSWEVNKEASRLHLRQRHLDQAARYLERCVAIMETDYYAWGLLLTCYYGLDDAVNISRVAEKALTQVEAVLAVDPCSGGALGIGARCAAALGQIERAKEWIHRALLVDSVNRNMRYNLAAAYAAYLDDSEQAVQLACEVLDHAGGTLIEWAQIDPEIDSIRSDPRFAKALTQAELRANDRRRALVQ